MKKIFFLLFALIAVTACGQNKKVYLTDFDKFIEGVKRSAEQYKEADWKKADQQFAHFKEDYKKYSNELTTDEKAEITKLESTYAALKVKKVGSEIKEGAVDAFDKVKDTTKEVVKDVKKGVKKAAKKGEKIVEGAKDGLKD